MWYQNPNSYISPSIAGVIGTIYQGNNCNECATIYTAGTNVSGSIYANTLLNNLLTTNTASTLLNEAFALPYGLQSENDFVGNIE